MLLGDMERKFHILLMLALDQLHPQGRSLCIILAAYFSVINLYPIEKC
jgi:hypothetical protein